MKEKAVVLQILSMHCAACATGIEPGLKRIDGILVAKVNFALKEAIVRFDEEKADIAKIKARAGVIDVFDGFDDLTNFGTWDSPTSVRAGKLRKTLKA